MDRMLIRGGRVLTAAGLREADVLLEGGRIAAIGAGLGAAPVVAADGLLVLPGIVDLHGDAFERILMPRPKTAFAHDIALAETDRQLVANGITTAYLGITVSWELGLRSPESAAGIVAALAALGPGAGCDLRLHLRWETFALEAAERVLGWLGAAEAPILAFNDHLTGVMEQGPHARKTGVMAERAGLSLPEFEAFIAGVWARRAEVPEAIERMAAEARAAGAVLLAHDERSPQDRVHFRRLGAVASEFPMTRETAAAARDAGEPVILGAPNVVRGGSHNGMMSAGPAVREGLCTALASDYYYPAPLHAAFRLVAEGLELPAAWALVSGTPARIAGLADRGCIAEGLRADLVLVEAGGPLPPRVVATWAGGRRVYAAG